MKIATIAALAFSLAFLAACDRARQQPKTSSSPAASGSSAAPESRTPMSSDNAGKREPTPPIQGQVDSKDKSQDRDFRHPDTGGK